MQTTYKAEFFTMSALQNWNRLSGKVVDDSSPEIFDIMLYRAVSNQIQLIMSLLIAGLDALYRSLPTQNML